MCWFDIEFVNNIELSGAMEMLVSRNEMAGASCKWSRLSLMVADRWFR